MQYHWQIKVVKGIMYDPGIGCLPTDKNLAGKQGETQSASSRKI
jgi:hypothetical protein